MQTVAILTCTRPTFVYRAEPAGAVLKFLLLAWCTRRSSAEFAVG